MKSMSELHDKAKKAEYQVTQFTYCLIIKQRDQFEKISKNFEKKINEYQLQMNIYAQVLKKMDQKCNNLSSVTAERPEKKEKKKENEEINAIVRSIRQNLK